MTPPLRVALAGCGRIAELFHGPLLARLQGVELRGVADPDGKRAERMCALTAGAVAVSDYRDLLDDDAIEAVVICLPTGLHADAACAAFAAGKHVYLEKPVATDVAAADRVRQAWRAAGRVGMIGFNQRFDPVVAELRRAREQGRLGPLAGVRVSLGAATRQLPDWKQQRATGGGVLLDLGSHAVDVTRFVLGQEIRSVSATIASRRFEDDTAALALTLEDGLVVQVHLTSTAVQESRCELLGENGRLTGDRYAGTLELSPPLPAYGAGERATRGIARLRRFPATVAAAVRPPRDARSYGAALEAFVLAVRGAGAASPDLEDGYRSLAVVVAAEESARTGRRSELGADPQ